MRVLSEKGVQVFHLDKPLGQGARTTHHFADRLLQRLNLRFHQRQLQGEKRDPSESSRAFVLARKLLQK